MRTDRPLTDRALAKELLQRLRTSEVLGSSDSHIPPTDQECIDASIAEDCVLRIRAQALGPTHSATLAVAYPSTETTYDELWSVRTRDSADRYFPLACDLTELTNTARQTAPASGLHTIDLLAGALNHVIGERVWPIRTRGGARAELELGRSSAWYSRLAQENWLPVVLLLDEGPQRAYSFARQVSGGWIDDESPRAKAYLRFIDKLAQRAASGA